MSVTIKSFDNMLMLIRRDEPPHKTISGLAEVIIYLDEEGKIMRIEIEFLKRYSNAELSRIKW